MAAISFFFYISQHLEKNIFLFTQCIIYKIDHVQHLNEKASNFSYKLLRFQCRWREMSMSYCPWKVTGCIFWLKFQTTKISLYFTQKRKIFDYLQGFEAELFISVSFIPIKIHLGSENSRWPPFFHQKKQIVVGKLSPVLLVVDRLSQIRYWYKGQ